MRTNRRRLPAHARTLLILGLLASSCGGSNEASPGERTTSASLASEATASTAAAPASTATESDVAETARATSSTSEPSTETTETTSSTSAPSTDSTADASSETTSVDFDGALTGSAADPEQTVKLRIESRVADITTDQFKIEVLTILNDERGWVGAGFTFRSDDDSPFTVILAEGRHVDDLCLPLVTYGTVSCQNGPVVALNATRWRQAVDHWDAEVADYRGYVVNHEVGHLLGQRHPKPRCVVAGRPAGVMEQQTAGLEGCTGNAWPRDWELDLARQRPVIYAPLPDWGPDPVPTNGET